MHIFWFLCVLARCAAFYVHEVLIHASDVLFFAI